MPTSPYAISLDDAAGRSWRLCPGAARRSTPWADEIVTAWQRVQAIPHPT